MPRILDVEQALLLLELEAPFDQRTVQLARRRMAKRWHPDIAPPGRRHEHERHLQAINEAADQLQQLAETARGGRVSASAVRAAARVQRFMTAAQHALAEGDAVLAAQRLVYARDADPSDPAVLRLLTTAFWQAGNLPAAARAVRDWARVDTDRPTPERFAARIYEDMGAIELAAEAAARAANRAPQDASEWERLGRLRLRLMDRSGAIAALARPQRAPATAGAVLNLLEYPQKLADPAHQQALLVDLDPRAGRCREHHVVAGLDRHHHAHVVPPVEPRADREHDPVLRWRLIGSRRDDQPRAADPVGVELLDDDPVEQRPKVIAHLSGTDLRVGRCG